MSSTTAVWPLKSGIRSGSRPRSLVGMTAKAPPPLASQLTARYSGLAWQVRLHPICGGFSSLLRGSSPTHFLISSHCHNIVPKVRKDLPRWILGLRTLRVGRPKTCLYFDERTKRPAMAQGERRREDLIVKHVGGLQVLRSSIEEVVETLTDQELVLGLVRDFSHNLSLLWRSLGNLGKCQGRRVATRVKRVVRQEASLFKVSRIDSVEIDLECST